MPTDWEHLAYDALARHPRLLDLAEIAHALMTRLAAEASSGRGDTARDEWVGGQAAERRLTRDDAATPFGNALDVLERGPEDATARALARALAAHAIAHSPPLTAPEQERAAHDLLWLAAHSEFDATGLLDQALGASAVAVWTAVADRVRRVDDGALPSLGRGEALLGAVALAASRAPAAMEQSVALQRQVEDPKLRRVLDARESREPLDPIAGEMTSAPRGPVATVLLGVTGLLLLARAAQLLGRAALSYRRPGELSITPGGDVRVRWRVLLLGATLRERDVVLPRAGLARAEREARFAGASLYGGLLALVVGSYVGVGTFVDGVRVASPALLGAGLLIAASGLAIDFALGHVVPSVAGRCRVVLAPRRGPKLCVGHVEIARADALLARLAGR
jgi:hypothetical protein